jgi:hypothetical protein
MESGNVPRTTLLSKLKFVKEDEQAVSYNVRRNSEDWRFVEFHLKSSVPYEVETKKVQVIYNSHMKTTFDKAAKNKLSAYTWVPLSNLDGSNTVSKLRTRGRFDIPSSGMDFLYGSIFENPSFTETESFFILCKVIIGRSYCKLIRDKNELSTFIMDINQRNFLPDGYDSVMFSPINYFTSSYPSVQLAHKTIRYRIFDSVNVLPMFYVTFVPHAYHLNTYISKKVCEECSEKEADFYCPYCEANFCNECGSNVHHEFSNDKSVKALYEKHLTSKIPVSKVSAGMCDCNMNKEAEFYCFECNTTICSYCRLLGSHSRGEMVNHELIDIQEHYNKLNPDKEDSMKHLNEKIKKGQETISKLKFQIHQLRENILHEAEKQLEYESEKDYTNAQLVLTDDLHLNITKLNLLTVMRDMISSNSDYYSLRQSLVKNVSMPDFIYVWFSYKRIIDGFNSNLEYYNSKNKYPDRSLYALSKFNEFKLISFNFEDGQSFKEKNKEEVTKISADMRKQVFDKSQQKLNIGNTKLLKEMIKKHQKNNTNNNNSFNMEQGLFNNKNITKDDEENDPY